jgi:hypothetical protein
VNPLPVPGGQGIAGSNPVSPTGVRSKDIGIAHIRVSGFGLACSVAVVRVGGRCVGERSVTAVSKVVAGAPPGTSTEESAEIKRPTTTLRQAHP